MNTQKIRTIISSVADGSLTPDAAFEQLRTLPFEDIGFAKIDHHRSIRKGIPETIFAEGKKPEQVVEIIARMKDRESNILATRCTEPIVQAVLKRFPEAKFNPDARTITLLLSHPDPLPGYVAVVCAGTSDIPVAEEAIETCLTMGCTIKRIYDVGVAGIHRLLEQQKILDGAHVVIVCAGMEGALPSVVAGLVESPVIAVPTSVGYGASFGGITALLGMLNSCATGIAVVNIDNGFGAGALAAQICRLSMRS